MGMRRRHEPGNTPRSCDPASHPGAPLTRDRARVAATQITAWGGNDWSQANTRSFTELSGVVSPVGNGCPCPIGDKAGEAPGSGCLVPPTPLFQEAKCVFEVNTRAVVDAARGHFACADLSGAELENQDTSSCSIYGSHLEQRLFMTDVMAPVQSITGVLPQVLSRMLADAVCARADRRRGLADAADWLTPRVG